MVLWNNSIGACTRSCSIFQVPSNEGRSCSGHVNCNNNLLLLLLTTMVLLKFNLNLLCCVLQVLLMTLQNAPPGLDYERDKRFSKVCQ
jgi:hypothetical protein